MKILPPLACLATLLGSLCLPSSVQATVLATETFDYTSSSLLSATGAGNGFSTGWKANAALDTNLGATYTVTAGSLTSPAYTSQGLAPEGNQFRMTQTGLMYRGLDTPINWGVNSTVFFSTLVRWSGNSSAVSSRLYFELGDPQVRFGLMGDGVTNNVMRLAIRNDGDLFGATSYAAATNDANREATAITYMLVAKVQTVASGNDNISLSIYTPSDSLPLTEPVTWDLTNDGVRTGSASYISFNSDLSFGGRTTGFDEFRIGSTYESVTAIPEPTTWALLAVTLTALLIFRRRRAA